jgi:YD repeat-containing protein
MSQTHDPVRLDGMEHRMGRRSATAIKELPCLNRDAHGNATSESSADIGSKSIQYDALGLPSSITDALGQATQIQRDALGRPTLITFADGKTIRCDSIA